MKDSNLSKDDMRRRAEATLSERQKKSVPLPTTEADTKRLVHELEVHQIELTMQNEELMQSRAQVEAVLSRYIRLYDFAPVGYLTLARDGEIHEINLTGAKMLGIERGELIKRRLGVFVAIESRSVYNTFLEKVFENRRKEICEVLLDKECAVSFWVRIEASCIEGEEECFAVALDITEQRHAKEEICRLNENLERVVNERTADLKKIIAQLEETNRAFVGRELKMVELKERIAELESRDL